jgi:PAT family beta-lactamase induction signal transducer AmpG
MEPTKRLTFWVAVLYTAEGLPFGVVSKIWPVWFRSAGVSLKEIGLMSLLSLPWSWKPLWAPLVDRFGSRKTWIVSALAALAILTALQPVFGPSALGVGLLLLLLAFTFSSATQDIAIDAWTVEVARGKLLGWLNGVRASAYRVAVIVSGGVALLVADRWGWSVAWWLLTMIFAGLALLVLFLPSSRPEGSCHAEAPARETIPQLFRGFLAWAFRPQMVPVLLFALLYKLGDQTMGKMVEPFWLDHGMTLSEIGLVSNTLGLGLTILGALLGGSFVSRYGLFQGLLWLGVGQAVSNLGYASVAGLSLPREAIYFASAFESFTQGLGTAALLAFLTAACRPEHAATEYALLSSLFAFSREIAGAVSGFLAEGLGYPTFFLLTTLLALPALLLLPWLRPSLRSIESQTPGIP